MVLKKEAKEVKTAKAVKFAKEGKARKTKKSLEPQTKKVEKVEAKKAIPKKGVDKKAKPDPTKKVEPAKKPSKTGKSAKNDKVAKVEKPAVKSGPIPQARKVARAGSAGRASKALKVVKSQKDVSIVEAAPPGEPHNVSETLEDVAISTEKIDEHGLATTDSAGKGDFTFAETLSEEAQSDEDNPSTVQEDFGELEEEEEEIIKHHSIDIRYPIDSDESEEEDTFEQALRSRVDRRLREAEQDFFAKIGHIPEMDQISVDMSIQRFIRKVECFETPEALEVVVEEAEEEGEVEMEEEFTLESKIDETFTSEVSLEYDFESSEEEDEAGLEDGDKKVSEIDLFEALLQLEKKDVVVEEIDFELLERLAQERQVQENTKAFLNELIDRAVAIAEYVDPNEVLRANLDKKKLFKQLYNALCDFTVERKVNTFVCRKVIDYYRRQKCFRPITPDTVEVIDEEKRKFDGAIDELNSLLGRETATGEIVVKKVYKVEVEEAKVKNEQQLQLDQLYSLMRKTFARRNSDRLNMFVDKRIREMSAVRVELSEVRGVLISRQHVMARLMEKMAALENIAPGLYLREYEDLQHDRYLLIKKIEERQDDLERYRTRYNANTNILAHLRESETMFFHTMKTQSEILEEVTLEKINLRAHIYKLKKSRIRVQNQIREMSFQCGLIDKPALCIDYDETLERCIGQRELIKNLKNELSVVEKRLAFYVNCLTEEDRRILFG